MARPLRLDTPGIWHHVMHRGGSRRAVYLTDDDRGRFLALLARSKARFGFRLHAYCLMGNHYHLLVEDIDGCLSSAIGLVNQAYTQAFNRHHGEDGALFRGRFHSRAVQDQRYALACLRYIHNNPVAAGLCRRPEKYLWSSHRAYLGESAPPWLHTATMLDHFGSEPMAARAALHKFVLEKPAVPDETGRLAAAAWGDTAWLAARSREVRARPARMTVGVPEGRRLGGPTVVEVVDVVARGHGIDPPELLRGGRGQHRLARDVAMHLLARWSSLTYREIGAAFGLKPTSIPWSARRLDGRAAVTACHFAKVLGFHQSGGQGRDALINTTDTRSDP